MSLPGELTVAQASKMTGLQRYTLRDAIHRGELAAKQQKIPGGFMYLIPLEGLRDFCRHRGVVSTVLGVEAPKKELVQEGEAEAKGSVEKGQASEATALPCPVESERRLNSSSEAEATAKELIELLRSMPNWEQRMEQLIEQIVEVQSDVLGLKKGFHQHLSKVEGRVVHLHQSVNGDLRTSMERVRHDLNDGLSEFRGGLDAWQHNVDTVFDDMRCTLQEVAASQSDGEMRQAFIHKLSVDNQSTVGEVKKLMVEVSETLSQVVGNQQNGSEMVEQRLDELKSSVDGVRRSVDRSTEMIIKWRQKVLRDQNQKGVKGWWNRLWGRSSSPILSK
ncbi:hypothetical protein GJ688_08410 [Heliobacillus mobilis]|uniref:Helix-turn-helix domain-containing protein n=1 Tax=Heliobacterium mobile TaxID=28064 RepID=A0A6I3SJB3_HELMO|nr:hypothetical protein [Heliobacterium mobile]MTV49001.1 hypothetical protein [Heliobacterium mobile]